LPGIRFIVEKFTQSQGCKGVFGHDAHSIPEAMP
jgi:hypothetical protein